MLTPDTKEAFINFARESIGDTDPSLLASLVALGEEYGVAVVTKAAADLLVLTWQMPSEGRPA